MKSSKNSNSILVRLTSIHRNYWLSVVSVGCLLVLWHTVTQFTAYINPLFLPSPVKVAEAARELFDNGLVGDIMATISRVVMAFVLSVVLALPLALLMSESLVVKRILTPYIDFIRYVPVPVLIPLTILFFGIGEEAKIVLLFIGTFFQVVLMFEADLLRVPQDYFDLAYSLQFSTSERIRMKVRAALPSMYDNVRISLGLCWSYVIIVELVASEAGLGHMIKEAQRFSHTADVYVGVLIMGLIGFASDFVFRRGFRHLFPYAK